MLASGEVHSGTLQDGRGVAVGNSVKNVMREQDGDLSHSEFLERNYGLSIRAGLQWPHVSKGADDR